MHRSSSRQAELDAQVLREHRIGSRLLAAPETYTALAARPGRALLGGLVVSVVLAMVVSVIGVAASARAGRERGAQASRPPATTPATAGVPTTTGTAPGAGSGGGNAGIAPVPTTISFGPSAAACEAGAGGPGGGDPGLQGTGIEVVPLFTGDGVLGRVELAGFGPGCVGRAVRLAALGTSGAELASKTIVLRGTSSLSVGGWRQNGPVTREELASLLVEIL